LKLLLAEKEIGNDAETNSALRTVSVGVLYTGFVSST